MAKRTNIYLTDIQVERLRIMSKKTGLTASELMRRAIDEYWERFEKKAKKRRTMLGKGTISGKEATKLIKESIERERR